MFLESRDVQHSPSVLVVEDDEPMATLLAYNLQRLGCSVTTIRNGLEAAERLASSQTDLVVLDWGLPGLSGIEILRQLRKRPGSSSTRVIMLTARGDPEDRKWGLALGADAYLVKPFRLAELIECIARLLNQRDAVIA